MAFGNPPPQEALSSPVSVEAVVASGWLIALALLAAYVGFIVWLVQTGRLAKWNLSLMLGVVLMMRTQHGKGLIEAVSRPRRLWNAFADLGTFVTVSGMVVIALFFLFAAGMSLRPHSGIEPLGASEILVIPGVNPFVPLWYGLIALIITLVVHEGGHGVLARANGLKVKSLGLLWLVLPIGAFVEPDDLDLKTTTRRKRLRVFAAGPAVNLLVAAICLTGFAAAMSAAEPVAGVPVAQVVQDAPADLGGLRSGDVIVAADGTVLPDWTAFSDFMATRAPGDAVRFELRSGDAILVELVSRWDALDPETQEQVLAEDPARAERLTREAFLGVRPLLPDDLSFLRNPVGSAAGFLSIVSLPIGEVRGAPYLSTYIPAFQEAPFEPAVFWPLATLAFWVFWINLMVGLTNILPMLPLDGGHIFRDALGAVVEKVRPGMDPRKTERLVGRAAGAMSLVILAAFLLQIIGPRIVAGLG